MLSEPGQKAIVQQGWKGIGGYSTLGMELAGSILLGLFGGRWLDSKFETGSAFALAGLVLGLAAGARAVWRALQRANREAEKIEQAEREARKAFHQREPHEPKQ